MKNLQKLVLTALFTAFTCVATMVIKFPTPTLGFIHIGDCMVLLAGVILGPGAGFLAGGLGSALADLFSGYPVWVPATFVIKGLSALIVSLLFRAFTRRVTKSYGKTVGIVLGGTIAEAVMVVGYFFAKAGMVALAAESLSTEALLTGAATAATGVPFNIVQGVTAVILSVVLLPILSKIPVLRLNRNNQTVPAAQTAEEHSHRG